MKVFLRPPDDGGLLLGKPSVHGLHELPLAGDDAPEKLGVSVSLPDEPTERSIWQLVARGQVRFYVPNVGRLSEETVPVYDFSGLALV